MPLLTFNGSAYEGLDTETVLDCLIRNGQKIPNSCRGGICQSCLLKTSSGADAEAQKGLSAAKKEAGLFLSCQQKMNKNFAVSRTDEGHANVRGEIISQERVSPSVMVLTIHLEKPLKYRAGKFVNLIRDDNLSRSYSIASQSNDQNIKLHVRKVPGGEMSTWLYDSNLLRKKMTVNGPLGECFLTDEMLSGEILLIGLGTGLAPLVGILQDAKTKGFKNPIRLFHGSLSVEGLYMIEELKNLEKTFENFSYHPVYLKGEAREGFLQGDLTEILKNLFIDKFKTTVVVCGDADMVKKIKQTVFMKGVSSKKILSDPFIPSKRV